MRRRSHWLSCSWARSSISMARFGICSSHGRRLESAADSGPAINSKSGSIAASAASLSSSGSDLRWLMIVSETRGRSVTLAFQGYVNVAPRKRGDPCENVARDGRLVPAAGGSESSMILAREALALLQEGNRRFVSDISNRDAITSRARRLELAASQEPFAAILGCSDSRVPVEIVFDQGLGDLFVIRVAGNIVAPSLIGSVEFAAEQFGTRLVVVLGHTKCGAIEATLQQLQRPAANQSHNLHSIVEFIRPSVEGLLATELKHDLRALVHE